LTVQLSAMHERTTLLWYVAQAQQRVTQGEVLIAEQRQRVADLRRDGRDTSGSEALLKSLLDSQQLHEEGLARLVREISRVKP
jgi:hypothetical protein